MYNHTVSFHVLPDTSSLTRDIIHDEILPVLCKQPGLVDLMVLQSSDEPCEFIVSTFWETKDHAENHHRYVYAELIALLKMHMDGEAKVRFYSVDTWTTHRIAEGVAAATAA
jgi:quinol monooxygenase YgiN